MIGIAAFVVGGAFLGSSVVASASAPTITVTPNSGLAVPNAPVILTGTGFTKNAKSPGGFVECSTAANQPTIIVPNFPNPLPVSCSDPANFPDTVNKAGNLSQTGMSALTGTTGPPIAGTDTGTGATGNSLADAVNFPCPPYQSQVNSGAMCEIMYVDDAGQSATEPIGFTQSATPDTTTTTTTLPGTCPVPVVSATATGTGSGGSGTVVVNPATCLVGGQSVTVTATGLKPYNASTNELGTVLECNSNASQPTVLFAGEAVPVSCTKVTAATFTPNAGGTLNTTFTISVGTLGPPTIGTDSAGNSATTDAGNYPCGPAVDSCVVAVGDLGGDQVLVPISFNTNVSLTNPGGSGTTTTTIKKATPVSTKAGSGSLAFTGTGPGLWWLGVIGLLMMASGLSVLVVVDGPRRLVRRARAGVQRSAHRGGRQ
jgi:hypothetical protein